MAQTGSSDRPHQQTVKTILVVEDNALISMFLVDALKTTTPYHILLANNASQALEFTQTVTPDLLLLDYHLPDMDGLKLYDHFQTQEKYKCVPTILMSGAAPTSECEKRRIFTITKPLDIRALFQLIERLFTENGESCF